MLVVLAFKICELKYTCGTEFRDGPACIYDSPDLFLPESPGKVKCYRRCDNTSFPNCPGLAQHKDSSCWGVGERQQEKGCGLGEGSLI